MRYGSVCSGIEAASVAWHPLGWSPAWYAEIEPFPSAVLERRWPGVPNHGDFSRLAKAVPCEPIDLLVGGTPCQSFSVAGKRLGLDDPRGNLTLEFVALAGRLRPRWVVWENVPGVLSDDDGRTFGTVLGLLGQLGYGLAYRVLDAQFFGVPQRRRRVFVVGHLGAWQPAAAVLLEPACLRGDPPPRREAREGVAAPLTRGAESGGRGGYAGRRREDDVNLVANPLGAKRDGGWRGDLDNDTYAVEPLTLAIRGRGDSHELEWRADGTANAVLTPNGGRAGIGVGAVAYGGNDTRGPIEVATAVNAHGGPHGRQDFESETFVAVAFRSDAGRDGSARTPSADAEGRVRLRDPGFNVYEECAPTLDASAPHGVCHQPEAVAFHNRQDPDSGSVTHPIGAKDNGLGLGLTVRRLTPRECERLQGFPDDYTAITYNGKPAADGPRYRALGNSMAVPCMRWIGRRVELVSRALEQQEKAS